VGPTPCWERKGARVAFVTTGASRTRLQLGGRHVPSCMMVCTGAGVPGAAGVALWCAGTGERDGRDAALANGRRAGGAGGGSARKRGEAVAISLLFSFANPETELRVEAALLKLGIPVSTSHRILPEFREFERASTIVVNAYLAPKMQSYLVSWSSELRRTMRRARWM